MRMPLSEFLANGDLKFVIILFLFLLISIYYFIKKITTKDQQVHLNLKMNKLVTWSLFISIFSLFLGLLHSFYFISKVNGIANNLLFGGLANVIITPTLGVAIAMIIKLLSTPISLKK
jgi:hypothetical protein